jgi:hypothetical protein
MTLIYFNSIDLAIVLSIFGNISVFHIFYHIFILVNQWFIRYVMKFFNTIILKYNILCVNKIPHVNKINKLVYSFLPKIYFIL